MMKLKSLLKNIPDCVVKGSKELIITGLSANSQAVSPGNLFIAKKGNAHDGNDFIPEAIKGGAVAIATDLYDPSLNHIVQIIHPQVNKIESALADNFYGQPSQNLLLVGITGTNGKTTTSYIIKNVLDALHLPCGLIGTIEYHVGKYAYQASRTTPDVTLNHKLLYEMFHNGCLSGVMEVTSHALDQGRVDHIDYDAAIFTNLSLDHLDYHGTMEEYALAKKKLFDGLGKGRKKKTYAIINGDSPWGKFMVQDCTASVFTFGIDASADLRAANIEFTSNGTEATLLYKEKSYACFFPIIGRYNIYNCLAALSIGLSLEFPMEKLLPIVSSFPSVKGRLQQIKNKKGLNIFVDFAHSDDALSNVLKTLNEVKKPEGRIIVVFGCGGDRDKSKRPKMAKACENLSQYAIITTDNPRSEDPMQICQEIIAGFSSKKYYHVELDRKAAIRQAIEMSQPKDIILIAGKGHEHFQVFAHKTIEFDDSQIAAELSNASFE